MSLGILQPKDYYGEVTGTVVMMSERHQPPTSVTSAPQPPTGSVGTEPPRTTASSSIDPPDVEKIASGAGSDTGSSDDGLKRTSDGIVLHPQPQNDPNDPLNWPIWKRDIALGVIGFQSFIIGGMTPLLASAFTVLSQEFDVSQSTLAYLVGSYMLAMGVGSVFFAPTAVLYGKRLIYIIALIVFLAGCLWAGSSHSFSMLLGARIIMGIGGSPTESLPSASIAEIYFLHERAYRLGIYTLLMLGGKNLVPMVAAFIIGDVSWNWVFWILAMIAGMNLTLTFFFVPETWWDRTPIPNKRSILETELAEEARANSLVLPEIETGESNDVTTSHHIGTIPGIPVVSTPGALRIRAQQMLLRPGVGSRSTSYIGPRVPIQRLRSNSASSGNSGGGGGSGNSGGDNGSRRGSGGGSHSHSQGNNDSDSTVKPMSTSHHITPVDVNDAAETSANGSSHLRSDFNNYNPHDNGDDNTETDYFAGFSSSDKYPSEGHAVDSSAALPSPRDKVQFVPTPESYGPPAGSTSYPTSDFSHGRKPYWKQLTLFTGRFTDDKWWMVALRPFVLYTYPGILFSTFVYSFSVVWLIVISETISKIFSAEPYNFSTTSVGLLYIATFIGGCLGSAVAGRASDRIVRIMSRLNGGTYEPEFRIVMIGPVLFAVTIGMMGFGWASFDKDLWIVPAIFLSIIGFGCSLGSTTAITYAVDSYKMFAAEALVTLNLSKNVIGFLFSLFVPKFLAASGSRTVFVVFGSVEIFICLFGIPIYIYGKRLRRWTDQVDLIRPLYVLDDDVDDPT